MKLIDLFKNNYFIIYDLEDNFLLYCDDLKECCFQTGMKAKEINRKFKNTNYNFISIIFNNKFCRLYMFFDDEES